MKKSRIRDGGLLIGMIWLGMALAGCGGVAGSHYGSASIVSVPANASVVNLEDGSVLGTTPLLYTWETENVTEKYIQLRLTAAGHSDEVTEFFLNARYGSKEDAEKSPKLINVNMKQAE